MLKYFDTHAHYIDERFSEDREKLLEFLKNEAKILRIGKAGHKGNLVHTQGTAQQQICRIVDP